MKNKKIAIIKKFNKSELDDLSSFLNNHNQAISEKYNAVLEAALEQALGKKFDPLLDANRVYSNVYQGSNQTDYYLDDKLIGTLSTRIDYDGPDFINNKVSFIIQFTPSLNN